MPKVVKNYRNQAKETILDSASRMIYSSGFQDVGMEEIARNIGITKGTLYLYFKNKEDLLTEACNRNMSILEKTMNETMSGNLDSGIKNFIIEELGLPDYVKFHWLFALSEANKNKKIKDILIKSYGNYVSIVSDFIEKLKSNGVVPEGIVSEEIAKRLIAFHNGILLSVMLGEEEREAISQFLQGIPQFFTSAANKAKTDVIRKD
jgi:AcrR family transcriptional regulator